MPFRSLPRVTAKRPTWRTELSLAVDTAGTSGRAGARESFSRGNIRAGEVSMHPRNEGQKRGRSQKRGREYLPQVSFECSRSSDCVAAFEPQDCGGAARTR